MTKRKADRMDGERWRVDGGSQGPAGARGFAVPWFRCSPCALTLALLLAFVVAPHVSAQNPQYNTGSFPRGQMSDGTSPLAGDIGNPEMEAKRLNALNAERQKSLVSDTNKLVKLTAELNAQINGTHPGSLTGAQLRMVAEIEKLAHTIREKMCTSVKGVPQLGLPAPAFIPPNLQ